MRICANCSVPFPIRCIVDGKLRVLANRKYCLKCSPFNSHNTRPVQTKGKRCCSTCGEIDLAKFYGNKVRMCAPCDNQYTIERGRKMKERARKHLGGKCRVCGFKKYAVALDIHHLDATKKDPKFHGLKGWKWERVLTELQNCILLCRNCHAAVHAHLIELN
jgi:hypothetical protein